MAKSVPKSRRGQRIAFPRLVSWAEQRRALGEKVLSRQHFRCGGDGKPAGAIPVGGRLPLQAQPRPITNDFVKPAKEMVDAMPPRKVLLSWIGYADFRALAATLPARQQSEVLAGLNPPTPLLGQTGPLKTLLDQERFDEVHLLSGHG